MNITIRQIFLGMRLLIRLCLPATVFIGVCTGIFIAFISCLGTITLTQRDPLFVGGAWLLLFIFYIIFGVALIRFNARLIHSSFGSEDLRVQRRMAALSGFPFCVLCLLCLMLCILSILSSANAVTVYVTGFGFVVFSFASCGYLLLIRFFLGRGQHIAGELSSQAQP